MKYFLAALVCVSVVHAAYEEQAGQLDWHKEHIGKVIKAEFAFRGRDRAFVITDARVVASLDTKDGSIVWRQVLEEEEGIDEFVLVPKPAALITLSKQGRLIRAWHAIEGNLLWEKIVTDITPVSAPALLVLPDLTGDGSSEVGVISGSKLQVMSGASGKLVWGTDLHGTVLAAAQGSLKDQAIIAVAIMEGFDVRVLGFEARSGEEVFSIPFASRAAQSQVAISSQFAVALSKDGQLCSIALGGGSPTCTKLSGLGIDSLAELKQFVGESRVAILSSRGVAIVDLSSRAASHHDGLTAVGGSSALPASAVAFAGAAENGRSVAVQISDVGSGKTLDEGLVSADLSTSEGTPLAVEAVAAAEATNRQPGKSGSLYRYLVVAQDASLMLLERGSVVWRREEGLARVCSTLFVDLPASIESDALLPAAKAALSDRVTAEVLTIKNSFGFIQPHEKIRLKELNALLSTNLLPHRDANGFRKLILALSATGTLYGLHSGDGRILWKLPLGWGSSQGRLVTWKTSHDAFHAPQILVLAAAPGAMQHAVVNAHSGQLLSSGSLQGDFQKGFKVPGSLSEGPTDQNVFAFLSSDGRIELLPHSLESRNLLNSQTLYTWLYDKQTGGKRQIVRSRNCPAGLLTGYKISGGQIEEQWTLLFSGLSNTLLQIATRDENEHIYSSAKILADRSLKMKYLNPNAIFMVSGPPDKTLSSALENPSLTVQLIDTVSGRIIFRQTLKGARGPATAVLSENWAAYSYYNSAEQRFEAAILEFYDAQPRSFDIPSLLFGNQTSTFSSFAPFPVEVLHQSYFTPVGIKAMAVTETRKGITSRQLLLGTDSDQVYLMDKRFLDPRRAREPLTAEEKAEMLPPYNEELSFTPTLFATHNLQVEGLKEIVTFPANLESTTLTLARGLDLFFVLVQPSKTFDLLPDDFPYAMLIAVTASLTIGALVLKRMEDTSAVKRLWI